MSFFKKIGNFFKSLVTCFRGRSRESAEENNTFSSTTTKAFAPNAPVKLPSFFPAQAVEHVNPAIKRLFYRIKPWAQKQVNRWREREALRATENIIQPAFFEEQKLKCQVAVHRAQVEYAQAFIESAKSNRISENKSHELVTQYHAALKEITGDLVDNYKRGLSLDVRPNIVKHGKKVILTQSMCHEILQNYEQSLQRDMHRHQSFRVLTLREAHFVNDVLNKRIQSLDDRQYELFQKREAARMQMYERDEQAPHIVKKSAEQTMEGLSFFVNQFKRPLHLANNGHPTHRMSSEIILATKERLLKLRHKRIDRIK